MAETENAEAPVPVWAFVLILLVTGVGGILLVAWEPLAAWVLVVVLMTFFVMLVGYNASGVWWRGWLIDSRKRISLARLQTIAWTLMVLSAYLTAVMVNVRAGAEDPMAVAVPEELWILMGISVTSLVGSPLLLDYKRRRKISPGRSPRRDLPEESRWSDVFRGEEEGKEEQLDIGRVQMFYFTFILLLAYGYAVGTLFLRGGDGMYGEAAVSELPPVSAGMLALLGISHTAYLGNKVLPNGDDKPDGDRSGGDDHGGDDAKSKTKSQKGDK